MESRVPPRVVAGPRGQRGVLLMLRLRRQPPGPGCFGASGVAPAAATYGNMSIALFGCRTRVVHSGTAGNHTTGFS